MPLSRGDIAPRFALPAAPGEIVDVGERMDEGPVVLLFFPLAFSSVCTEELCAVRDSWGAWTALEAEVFGISVDSPFVTRRFREELGLPFPLLSDFNHDVGAEYDVLYEDYFGLRGVARRAAFVVGADGRIAYAWVGERDDVLPDFQALRRALAATRTG
ncbi:MAG TPA: redoxin domain-containing protein [Gemmatimonadota bacterium]|nr:redoxin domain-containing protein [Gemmatimonadota bacterium]